MVFWKVIPCSLVDKGQHCTETCSRSLQIIGTVYWTTKCHFPAANNLNINHLRTSNLTQEQTAPYCSSFIPTYHTTRCRILDNPYLNIQCCQNLNLYMKTTIQSIFTTQGQLYLPLLEGAMVTTLVLSPSPTLVDAVTQNWYVAPSWSRTVSWISLWGLRIRLCVPSCKNS